MAQTIKPLPASVSKKIASINSMETATLKALNRLNMDAVHALEEAVNEGTTKERIRAAQVILSYTLGKPTERKYIAEPPRDEEVVTEVEFVDVVNEIGEEKLQSMIEEQYDEQRKAPTN